MDETKLVPPQVPPQATSQVTSQVTPELEGSSPIVPLEGSDQQALAILDRAAIEMADRTPPAPPAEPAGISEDAGAQMANPSEPSEPPIGTQSVAEHKPAAEDVPAEIMQLAQQMKPAQDTAHDIAPVETSVPIELTKPASQFKLVEQFDPMTILNPAATVAPARPKIENKIETKIAPPAFRTMIDDHFRLSLTGLQSLVLAIAIVALVIGAFGMAAYGWATAHDWSCRIGLVTNYCPPSEVPKPMVPPEIPS